jgi:hypothetical protein
MEAERLKELQTKAPGLNSDGAILEPIKKVLDRDMQVQLEKLDISEFDPSNPTDPWEVKDTRQDFQMLKEIMGHGDQNVLQQPEPKLNKPQPISNDSSSSNTNLNTLPLPYTAIPKNTKLIPPLPIKKKSILPAPADTITYKPQIEQPIDVFY